MGFFYGSITTMFNISDKITVLETKQIGTIKSMEILPGFRGRQYTLYHINIDGKLYSYKEWEIKDV